MSNLAKDQPSIRVHAPPGGHSHNIFGTSESEESAANKKKNMDSHIFGSAQDNTNPMPAKHNHNKGSNIFGTDSEETQAKATTTAGQFKQTQMRSNIFGTDDPTPARAAPNKSRSNIFGNADDDEQNKRQGGVRQGLRDPNASRMGYNPINGESYSAKSADTVKQADTVNKATTEGNENVQVAPTNSVENNDIKTTADKPASNADGNNAPKNLHTSVRVFHPPGGKSSGPLW